MHDQASTQWGRIMNMDDNNEPDLTMQEVASFHLPQGTRESDRLEADLVQLIAEKLNGKTIIYNGKECTLKTFGKIGVDVKGIDGFDHIEITFKKTGWGRAL